MQGLAGLEIGRQLLYRTCQAVHLDVPSVQLFLTMSPIPGFLPWLRRCVARAAHPPSRPPRAAPAEVDAADPDADGDGDGDAARGVGSGADDVMQLRLQSDPHRQVLLERLFYTEDERERGAHWHAGRACAVGPFTVVAL